MDAKALIGQRRAEFVSAFNREDCAELARLCTDDVILIPPNQPPIVGAAAAEEWWRVGFEVSRTRLHVQSRELYVANGWAFDWFDWTLSMVPLNGGAPLIDFGHSFWIWRCDSGTRWHIARELWNSGSETPSLWAGGWAASPADGFPLLM